MKRHSKQMLRSMFRSVAFRPLVNGARTLVSTRVARMADPAPGAAGSANKINLRFGTPSEMYFSDAEDITPKFSDNKVDGVSLPVDDGVTAVMPNAYPAVIQLAPGMVAVHQGTAEPKKFYISGGFAIVKADSTVSITAAEGMPAEDLDTDLLNREVDRTRADVDKATDALEKTKAEIAYQTVARIQMAVTGTMASK